MLETSAIWNAEHAHVRLEVVRRQELQHRRAEPARNRVVFNRDDRPRRATKLEQHGFVQRLDESRIDHTDVRAAFDGFQGVLEALADCQDHHVMSRHEAFPGSPSQIRPLTFLRRFDVAARIANRHRSAVSHARFNHAAQLERILWREDGDVRD
jgi:hypothetical protein